ncbi:MAG: right-handed parallel beta-helix repeat-containing protein [Amphiplicatus sp.]
MNRVVMLFAAAVSLGALSASAAERSSIGGFPTDEPGFGPARGSPRAEGNRDQVTVSQADGSRVRTIARAVELVRPGGTILVEGGVYNENLALTKAVAIRGVPDAYGRNVVIRPAPDRACVTVDPRRPGDSVSLSDVVFKFDSVRYGAPCIDVYGGNFALRDSFVIPADADIPLRAAYGELMPELYEHIAAPPRDYAKKSDRRDDPKSRDYALRMQGYVSRHSQPAGAEHQGWSFMTGGSNIENLIHVRTTQGGPLDGPKAGVRVAAGDVRLEGNVIIGAQIGVEVASADEARIRGAVTNNVILGNGVGVGIAGVAADLLVTRNTIRYNQGPGVRADVYDGVKLIANEFSGNGRGIDLSEKVRMATITSNLIIGNVNDAMKVSSGFYGAVAANTIALNGGCTIQFFSAEQKILNKVERKVIAFKDFDPQLAYEPTNYAEDNGGDDRIKRRKRKLDRTAMLAPCGAGLN